MILHAQGLSMFIANKRISAQRQACRLQPDLAAVSWVSMGRPAKGGWELQHIYSAATKMDSVESPDAPEYVRLMKCSMLLVRAVFA